ncbi:amino acid adenylation domain-containing protein [Actinoplanes sp. NEAU-A12]|uniref:Amino acid adenylation domain-containing protein n=1 Tax=Actinoplanes sandaracinus TaxID=3045177 RepID=A0ABT6WWG9_9ACTN|nr:amino acid adenylation domain-containing protein [Actinoplanes sandaracinus]MDI6104069.1 amino acid adenylation domain-containing protein [Actinoplanes sandaracinus]
MDRNPGDSRAVIAATVHAIWRDILDGQAAEPHDDFFDVGGTSLGAVKFLAEIESSFGLDALTPEELYTRSTFEAIVAAIESNVRRAAGFPDHTIAELFARRAAETPDGIALRFRDRAVTYRQLDRAANGLAWRLRRQGVGPGTVVATAMARTPGFVTALLGILKAGGAYLPIDPAWPAARLATMMERASVPIVVTEAETDALPDHVTRLHIGDTDTACADGAPETGVDPGDPAIVNFTSGSTGEPKGVLTPHRGVTSLLFPGDFAKLSADTVLLAHMSPSFDGMTVELWGPLLHGGTCVLFDGTFPSVSRLRTAIRDNGVNTLTLTTALFNVVVDSAPDVLDPLSALVVGGEAQSPRHFRAAHKRLPHLPIVNAYGPTETTVIATCFPVADLMPDAPSVPIGRPLPNREVSLLGPDLIPVAAGEAGEICVSGPGLAIGYVGRPDLTAERFVTIPSPNGGQRRVYRTGDLARLAPSGELEFLGRADRQVKLNGQRIELEEIERVLATHPRVHQAAALIHGEGVTRTLKAVLVAPEGVPPDLGELLARSLPAYMVPAGMRAIDALPLNTNGKIDRAALARLFDHRP